MKMPTKKKSKGSRPQPSSPTSYGSQKSTINVVPIGKLLKRFYEPLVLLHTLSPVQDDHVSRSPVFDHDIKTMEQAEMRREVQEELCWVCDYTKGGATVTAIAIQSTPQGVIYWLASNTDPARKIKPFLVELLDELNTFDYNSTSLELESRVFRKAIKFGKQKMKEYWSLLQKQLQTSIDLIEEIDSLRPLSNWLKKFQESADNVDDLERFCLLTFEARRNVHMQSLLDLYSNSGRQMNPGETCYNAFRMTRHYLGRLGSYMRSAKVLVAAGKSYPSLFESASVRACPSPGLMMPPLMEKKLTAAGIAGRMFPSHTSEQLEEFLVAFESMDTKIDLMTQIIEKCRDPKFKPRVHAELVLLEAMHTAKVKFLDNDKFIACSKPACFCCYHYIYNHPGLFVKPSSHNKIWLNWRPPGTDNPANQEALLRQRDIINAMVREIRRKAVDQVLSRQGPRDWHPDSTTGIPASLLFESGELNGLDSGMWSSRTEECLATSEKSQSVETGSVDLITKSRPHSSILSIDDAESVAINGTLIIKPFVAQYEPDIYYADSESDGGVPLL